MKFAGICLITKNVSKRASFYMQVLGVEADGDDTHVELLTEGGGVTIFLWKAWKTWHHNR
jgi:catechol-2,3-dioxygenase